MFTPQIGDLHLVALKYRRSQVVPKALRNNTRRPSVGTLKNLKARAISVKGLWSK